MVFSVSWWNRHLPRSSGTLATHSYWCTVCLGEITISLGRLVLLLPIQNVLQCVSVKSPSLWVIWYSCYSFILVYSVSWWNCHLSRLSGMLDLIQNGLQCVSMKYPSDLQYVLVKLQYLCLHWLSFYPFRLIYSVSRWNCRVCIFTGYLSIHAAWSTVCLGEIADSLTPLVTFLSMRADLQCLSVKLMSLYLHWLPFYPFRLIYSVSRLNYRFSISTGYLPVHSDWSTVCPVEIAISLSPPATFPSIQTDLQCVSVKLPSLYFHWLPFCPFRLIYSVSRWNCCLFISTGYLSVHSNLSTVCLGEIAISLSAVVPLLSIQTCLQCVSVKLFILFLSALLVVFPLIYSVSQSKFYVNCPLGALESFVQGQTGRCLKKKQA